MIEYLNLNTSDNRLNTLSSSAVGCEILSEYLLYGENSHKHGAFFWHQDYKLFLSMRNAFLRISGIITDIDELLSFIDFVSPLFILVDDNIKNQLPYPEAEKGEILVFEKTGEKKEIISDSDISVFNLASFFKKENMITNEEAFIMDAAYAVSKNHFAFEAIKENGEIISAACSFRITENSAVINIAATNKNHRGKGLGTLVTEKLKNKLSGRTLYVFKETNKNDSFYNNLSFRFKNNFYTLKRI